MTTADVGDSVAVHLTGKLPDGDVFITSEGKDLVRFEVGAGRLLPGLEEAVIGMSPGDSKAVTIQAKDAYGNHREEQVVEVDRARLGGDVVLEVGQTVHLTTNDGKDVRVIVAGLSDGKVTLDANHPLAGKDLTVGIKLVEITV